MESAELLAPYLSPDAREAELTRLVELLGGEVHTYGSSVEDRPLRAAYIPCSDPDLSKPPEVLLCANIHGLELIATCGALGFLAAMQDPTPRMEALRQQADIWVIPSMNPDGYARTWRQQGIGKLHELRTNAHGVDLNRNFPPPGPQPWYALSLGGWATGSSKHGNAFYRGTGPLSEPETAALDTLLQAHNFHASINLHSTMGTMLPAHVTQKAHFAGYRDLCNALRKGQSHTPYRRVSSMLFDWFTGEQEDHQHHIYHTWSICFEMFPLLVTIRQHIRPPRIFWRFNPRDPQTWVSNDVPGFVEYYLAALSIPPP